MTDREATGRALRLAFELELFSAGGVVEIPMHLATELWVLARYFEEQAERT